MGGERNVIFSPFAEKKGKPTNFKLLQDSVYVPTKVIQKAVNELWPYCMFINHAQRSKKRRLEILNDKNAQDRLFCPGS